MMDRKQVTPEGPKEEVPFYGIRMEREWRDRKSGREREREWMRERDRKSGRER